MLASGSMFGGYRIEGVLGRGGMGTVYEATQVSLRRTVALKVLSADLGANAEFRERFRREGRQQAAIDHDHIVTVYEAGEAERGLYIAMRLIHGSTLKQLISTGELDDARVLGLLRQVADALDAAHAAGLVHRDVKPQNVLVGPGDHAYLADFGLTKAGDQTALTLTGAFVGTLDYSSPERLRGETATPASDIYSLAAVVYECLAGAVPFPRPSGVAVIGAHLFDAPPRISEVRPHLSEAVDEALAGGLAKDPAGRPPTASALIDAVESPLGAGGRSRTATPPAPRASRLASHPKPDMPGRVSCPSCGRPNPEAFDFCGACGAPLVAPTREVRKVVTVVFADVTGSTALGESLDPEALRRVMSRYFEEMKGVLELHGGTVEKFIGDAVLAVFGIPTLHEDDACRALHAAALMRERLADLNSELERDFGVRLDARIGVNTGEIVTGDRTFGQVLATADAVTVAARLEQRAAPGEILLGAHTFALARGAVEVEQVEPLALKGKAEPVAAYRLLRAVEGAPAFERRLDAPLVGRSEELARLRSAFAVAVSERRPRLVTVLGPPGIGKSRLARELAADPGGEAAVLAGRCLPYGEGITYWPVREIFAAANAEEELETALAAGAPEEIFWAVRKALERRARERPLMLIVDDIHWAEPTLLDLIEHLADWMRDAQLLLLCLARPELLDERPAWGGRANAETLGLEPLDDSEADELIEGYLSGSRLEEQARARVREVAEGNPLFVEQLLAMLAETGAAERVPPTIQALLAARLDALPEHERDLLERASVVGLEFEWGALRELTPDRQRPGGAQLAALVRKELIRPHQAIEDGFRFRHMLIRDAAYERIPKEMRSELHERFAGWLDRAGEYEEIVGYHLEQAYRCLADLGPPGTRGRDLARLAAERLAASGVRAYSRGDMPAAVNLLERATALLPMHQLRRLSLLPSLGRALVESGQLDQADSVLSEAIEGARAIGERAVGADAAVARAALRLHIAPGRSLGQEEVWRELEAAIPLFEELGDEARLARALDMAGKLRFWRGETAAAIGDLEQAARHACNVGDRAQEAESLQYVLKALVQGPAPVDEALARSEELRLNAEAHRPLLVHLLRTRAQLEAMQGRFEAARHLIAESKARAEELGLKSALSRLALEAGAVEELAGDADAAESELRRGCDELERVGDLGHLSSLAPRLADALYAQGRDEEALRLTERWDPDQLTVPEDVDAHVTWRRVRAKLLARRGDFEEAERLARAATSHAARTDFLDLHAHAAADLAEVLRLLGRPQEAAAAIEDAIGLYEQKGNVAATTIVRGRLAELPIDV